MKTLKSLPIDTVDLLSVPMFVSTMLWESRVLATRELREEGDLDDATAEELSDPSLPADPLVPVGYERRDTRASLTMLGGNIAVNLAVGDRVERPAPYPPGGTPLRECPSATQHFGGGTAGEGQQQDPVRARSIVDEPSDAAGKGAGLARPRPRDDEQRPITVEDRATLTLIEPLEPA